MAESASTSMLPPIKEIIEHSKHELELGYIGELDLHKHVTCKKNPGHKGFIPIMSLEHHQFDETSLADATGIKNLCQHVGRRTVKLKGQRLSSNRSKITNFQPLANATEIKKFCQHVGKRTVKLTVQRVSSNRSKLSNFPLSNEAGKKVTSCGSGCLTDINVKGEEGYFPCPLEDCSHSTEPHLVYGNIIITTAAHVIFDDEEAKETIVEFFYDDPTNKSTVEKAHGFCVRNVNIDKDNCELMCVTHSLSLFKEISQMVNLRLTYPDIFQFADNGENTPTFISLLSALADIRDNTSQDRLTHLCHIFYLVRHEVETICTYYEKINKVLPDSDKVKDFLLKAEQLTGQNGLMEKVLSSLSSKKMICDFMEISFQVIIEKVAVLGALSLMSKDHKRRFNIFIPYFFGQIVDSLNSVTRSIYQNTSNYIDNTFVVHISHPHGMSKQVSLGKYFFGKTEDGQRRHIYTVPTCNGCSGGPVWILPGGHDGKVRWEQVYGVPHGGSSDKGNDLNHSSSQVFGLFHLETFLDSLNIRPYGHLLQNIQHYQHLLNIGQHQDLPNMKHDLHVVNFILFSHPKWQDLGYSLAQQKLFYDLNQTFQRLSSDGQSLVPEPGQSHNTPCSDLTSPPASTFGSLSLASVFSDESNDSVQPITEAPSVIFNYVSIQKPFAVFTLIEELPDAFYQLDQSTCNVRKVSSLASDQSTLRGLPVGPRQSAPVRKYRITVSSDVAPSNSMVTIRHTNLQIGLIRKTIFLLKTGCYMAWSCEFWGSCDDHLVESTITPL